MKGRLKTTASCEVQQIFDLNGTGAEIFPNAVSQRNFLLCSVQRCCAGVVIVNASPRCDFRKSPATVAAGEAHANTRAEYAKVTAELGNFN